MSRLTDRCCARSEYCNRHLRQHTQSHHSCLLGPVQRRSVWESNGADLAAMCRTLCSRIRVWHRIDHRDTSCVSCGQVQREWCIDVHQL